LAATAFTPEEPILKLLPAVTLTLILQGAFAAAQTTPRAMEPKDLPSLRSAQDAQISPDGRTIAFVVSQHDTKENLYQTDIFLVNTNGGETLQFTRHGKNDRAPRFSPDGSKLAFISEREDKPQIFLADLRGGDPWKLSELKGGVSGFEWSPDGTWIVALATDAPSEEEEKRTKAKDDERVIDQDLRMTHLHRIDVASRETRRLTEGAFTLSDAEVSPDGTEIVAVRRPTPRADDGSASDIVIVKAEGGTPNVLYENSGVDTQPRYSPDGRTIAVITRDGKLPRSGTSALAVVPRGGGPLTRLTPVDLSPGNPLWSKDGASILFTATVGVEARLYSVAAAAKGASPRELMKGAFLVSAPTLSADGSTLAYLRQDPRTPNEVHALTLDRAGLPAGGAAGRRLTTLNPKLAELRMSVSEAIRWKAPDGREIEGLLHRPEGSSGKKLPLVVHVHGGPAGAYTLGFPGSMNNYHHILTARGYAVFQPNFRGSTGYGDAFQRLNVNDWGKGDFQDIMSGVDSLVAKGVADPDRMALHGWSYGGYMCAWSITQTTRFKAASCGAGLTNLISMYGTNDIPSTLDDYFGGGPYGARGVDAYWQASAMAHVTKAKTPTLILHGQVDDRVPLGQAQELYLGLKRQGVPTELVVYPREPHGFREPNHQVDKVERELAWFAKWGVK
jgi:dipeptidyl aminopeptidase/acylaminoacyl peptidase